VGAQIAVGVTLAQLLKDPKMMNSNRSWINMSFQNVI